jgi:hypothetical protein
MENFSEFQLETPELIFGGDHVGTRYTHDSGSSGRDIYDTDAHSIVYFAPDNKQ